MKYSIEEIDNLLHSAHELLVQNAYQEAASIYQQIQLTSVPEEKIEAFYDAFENEYIACYKELRPKIIDIDRLIESNESLYTIYHYFADKHAKLKKY